MARARWSYDALLAKSVRLRLALVTSSGLTLIARLLIGLLPQAITLAMSFTYSLLVSAAMTQAVFGPGDVNHRRIAGAVFVYLNVALLYSIVFAALVIGVPATLSGMSYHQPDKAADLIHFSFSSQWPSEMGL